MNRTYNALWVPDPDGSIAKTKLVIQISTIISQRELSQTQAAELLGTTPVELAEMLNGKFKHYSMSKLLQYLSLLEFDDEVDPPTYIQADNDAT